MEHFFQKQFWLYIRPTVNSVTDSFLQNQKNFRTAVFKGIRFIQNSSLSVNRSSGNNMYTFVVPVFHTWFNAGTFWPFWLFFCFCFCFMRNKYYLPKLMLLNFRRKYTQWNLDTKVYLFHESISCFMKCPWNYISCNIQKEKFHIVSLP